jgi:hypothetical protein
MGLTAARELTLRDVGLVEFFEEHRGAFEEMAATSRGYAETYVARTGLPLRRDDVAAILVPALTTNEQLREFLAGKKLRQKYWYADFADLILDRVWEEEEEGDGE